jgi:hypothetical protein
MKTERGRCPALSLSGDFGQRWLVASAKPVVGLRDYSVHAGPYVVPDVLRGVAHCPACLDQVAALAAQVIDPPLDRLPFIGRGVAGFVGEFVYALVDFVDARLEPLLIFGPSFLVNAGVIITRKQNDRENGHNSNDSDSDNRADYAQSIVISHCVTSFI